MLPPSLDLFDLDEQFSSEKIRLAQITNKCSDDDIEYYIKECGDILGINQYVNNPDDPKAVLSYIFQELVKYKSSASSWMGTPYGNGQGDVHKEEEAASNRAMQDQNENSYVDLWLEFIVKFNLLLFILIINFQ